MLGRTACEDAVLDAQAVAHDWARALHRGEPLDPGAGATLGAATERWSTWTARAIDLGEDEPADHPLAAMMGRAAAIALHTSCHAAYDAGDGAAAEAGALVMAAERAHIEALARLRTAALAGAVTPALTEVWRGLTHPATHPLRAMCAAVGALDPGERARGALGVRASMAARRGAMLAAGCAHLHRRIATTRLRRGLPGIAGRRGTLWRGRPRAHAARTHTSGVTEGDRVEYTGLVTATGWVDRPEVPYSYATTERCEVRVHRRDLLTTGVAVGAALWVRGKFEPDDGAPVLVAEFEGPGTHAGAVWEDWLADQVRHTYDLYPLVIDMVAEFARLGVPGARAELAARTGTGVSDD